MPSLAAVLSTVVINLTEAMTLVSHLLKLGSGKYRKTTYLAVPLD